MRIRKWIWGLFFIGAAAIVLLNQFNLFENISVFSLLITVFLIPVIVESAAKLQFYGVFFPLALLAIVYEEPLGIERITPWPVLLAALFLSIGFSILFRHRLSERVRNKLNGWQKEIPDGFGSKRVQASAENFESCSVSFGAVTKYLQSANLEGATLHCSFGNLKVFFDRAVPSPNGVQVNVSCSFGETVLYVPKEWQVLNKASAFLGDVKISYRTVEPGFGPMLVLTGDVNFGEIKVIFV